LQSVAVGRKADRSEARLPRFRKRIRIGVPDPGVAGDPAADEQAGSIAIERHGRAAEVPVAQELRVGAREAGRGFAEQPLVALDLRRLTDHFESDARPTTRV
jgi:hypothetical protein